MVHIYLTVSREKKQRPIFFFVETYKNVDKTPHHKASKKLHTSCFIVGTSCFAAVWNTYQQGHIN